MNTEKAPEGSVLPVLFLSQHGYARTGAHAGGPRARACACEEEPQALI